MPFNKTHLKPFSQTLNKGKLLLLLWFAISAATAQENAPQSPPEIPEPLLFDLVRGLGAAQGELEINALADFPLNNTDQRGIEWAPEIEYALFDGFALELEFPMTDGDLEAIKWPCNGPWEVLKTTNSFTVFS